MSKTQEETILEGLNPMQREAARHCEGPLLIIAGAGSGKTRTLAHRLALILSQNSAQNAQGPADKSREEKSVLAITFTNKAAEEMRSRIGQILKKSHTEAKSPPFIGTFHSFGAKILRSIAHLAPRGAAFTIYDEDDTLSVVKSLLKELGTRWGKVSPAAVRNEIGKIKNELLDPSELLKNPDNELAELLADIYPRYEKVLEENNAFDFDDLIEKPVRIFQQNPVVLARFQNEYGYILIDEYQDTNIAQYTLVRLLAEVHRNICVVGDDAQSIYRWRSADFRNFLNFDKDWEGSKVVKLEQNYRSTKNILRAADAIIDKNVLQKKKTLWTDNEIGAPIWVVEEANERSEARFIAHTVKEKIFSGAVAPKDIAVFYRTNAQSRAIEEAFLENQISYRVVGGVRFYERKEVKDIVAYLRAAANPHDRLSLERIIAVPPRGISKERFKKMGSSLANAPELAAIIEGIRAGAATLPLTELIGALLETLQYRKYLRHEYANADERWENILELLSLANRFEKTSSRETALADFLESIHLMQGHNFSAATKDARPMPGNDSTGVSLMTIHSAKGLEFDIVFVAGCEEGILPHSRSLYNTEELEEERRLAYVAITRAKKELYLVFARYRTLFGSGQLAVPSQFIYDIPPEITEFVGSSSDSLDPLPEDGEEFIEF